MSENKINMETNRKSINILFNLAIFAFIIFSYVIDWIFTPETDERVPWDYVFDMNPILGLIGAAVFIIISIVVGAYIIQQFWNRLLSDIFNIREIIFQEALSIILIFGLFSIG